jgi:hypothetical protein
VDWAWPCPGFVGYQRVTLAVTNSAGLSSVKSLTLVKSGLTFALTNISGSLWLPTVNVSGIISDSSASVYVNGVQGTNYGNGTWGAGKVPVSAGGVASFIFSTTPPGPEDDAGMTIVYKNPEIVMESAKWGDSIHGCHLIDSAPGLITRQGQWNCQTGGVWTYHEEVQDSNLAALGVSTVTDTILPDWTIAEKQSTYSDGTWEDDWMIYDFAGVPVGINFNGDWGNYVDVSGFYNLGAMTIAQEEGALKCGPASWSGLIEATKSSTVKMTLHTGGKSLPRRQNLFALSATAQEILEKAPPPLWPGGNDITSTQIKVDGQALGTDGIAWKVYADGSTANVTPIVKKPMYSFTVGQQKYPVYINLVTATTNADLSTNVPEVCVGQKVTFSLAGLPTDKIVDVKGKWTLPQKYVNHTWQNYVVDPATGVPTFFGSHNYDILPSLLENTVQTSCWYVNKPGNQGQGHVSVGLNLKFSNGQIASVAANGDFTVYRPSVNQPITYQTYGAGISGGMLSLENRQMRFDVTINSKYPGNFGLTQLVNYHAYPSTPGRTTYGNYWLDGREYYDGLVNETQKNSIWDSPGVGFFGLYASYDGLWQDYVRFTPNDGIAVTLGRIDWDWSAEAIRPPEQVASDSGANPQLHDDDAFPEWLDVKTRPPEDE